MNIPKGALKCEHCGHKFPKIPEHFRPENFFCSNCEHISFELVALHLQWYGGPKLESGKKSSLIKPKKFYEPKKYDSRFFSDVKEINSEVSKRIVIRCRICGKELDFESNSIGRLEPKRVVQFGKTYKSKTEVDFICKKCDEKYGNLHEI